MGSRYAVHFFRAVLALTAVGVVSSVVTSAEAQGWLADRDRAEGPGFRFGDLELHPGVGAELGYDSNVFLAEDNPEGSLLLRVSPHLMLSTLGPERQQAGGRRGSPPAVAFRGGLSANLYHFFDVDQPTNVAADADLRLTINPQRPVSLSIYNTFGRTIRPFTERGAIDGNYARSRNIAGAQVTLGTEARVLELNLGYELELDYFEGQTFQYASSLTHRVNAKGSWTFYPQTALLYDFRLDFREFDLVDDPSTTTLLSGQTRARTRVGLNGAITQKLSVLGMVGYAAGFYDEGDEYEGVVGQLEGRWKFGPSSNLALGYDREFHPSFVGNFYRVDRGYLNLQVLMGGVFLVGLEGAIAHYDFGAMLDTAFGPLGAGGEFERSDIRPIAELFLEYRVQDWLAFNGTVSYIGDFTDFNFARDAGTAVLIDPAEFQKFQTWIGARVFY